jgi:hypothetical protein
MATAGTVGLERPASGRRLIFGFVAGFLAVLLFHQPVLAFLAQAGFIKANIYSFGATGPLGVPEVISLSFWGGIWGMLLARVEAHFPRGIRYWIYAFGFGAIFPTLVAWFVVAPLKTLPVAAGWQVHGMITGLAVNGAWGVGTALLLALGYRMAK